MAKLAVLGLGAMGTRMATKLLDAGHDVFVYNRTPGKAEALQAQGAKFMATPKEAVANADVVISMVTDDDASREVWLGESVGAVHGLRPDTVAIESSTLSLRWVQELGTALKKIGVDFLDAPVAGSRPQAEAAQLIYFVGGEQQILDKVKDILSVMGAAVHYMGPSGAGMMMKFAVNAIFGIQVAAFAEMLNMAETAGIAMEKVVETLGTLPTTSPALKLVSGQMSSKAFAPLFPISLVEKDFRYIKDAAKQLNAEVPATEATWNIFRRAALTGLAADNISGVIQLYTDTGEKTEPEQQLLSEPG